MLRVLRLMLPVMLGLGLINFNLTIDLSVATLVPGGHADAYLNYAFRLFMLPQGLFSVAVTAVLFPRISQLAARGDMSAFGHTIASGTRTILFLLMPAAAISIVLAEPITRVLFQHESFTSADTQHVAAVLIAFSLGLMSQRHRPSAHPGVLRPPASARAHPGRAREPLSERGARSGSVQAAGARPGSPSRPPS